MEAYLVWPPGRGREDGDYGQREPEKEGYRGSDKENDSPTEVVSKTLEKKGKAYLVEMGGSSCYGSRDGNCDTRTARKFFPYLKIGNGRGLRPAERDLLLNGGWPF